MINDLILGSIDKPTTVTYRQINEIFTQILVDSYSNNSVGCTPYMLASVDYANEVILQMMSADFLEKYGNYEYDIITLYAVLSLILPLIKQRQISYNAVLCLIFLIERPSAFSSSSTWEHPNDIMKLIEKCILYSRQNNHNEQDALSNTLGLIERVVLMIDEQINPPSAKKWYDNIDIITTINPDLIVNDSIS